MKRSKSTDKTNQQPTLPSTERVQEALAQAKSMDDFFGKGGIFARLFAQTLEQMLEAELSAYLGYEPHEAKGRNSGNNRNGHYQKKVRTSSGQTTIQVPRDCNGDFEPKIVRKYAANTNELEAKIIGLYTKGMSTRDIQETLTELFGVFVSATTVSQITEKVWPLVEAWRSRLLAAIYPIIYLDAIHLKLRREGKVANTAVYIVLGVDLDGHRDVLGHWVGAGGEGANFWLSVVTDLQNRGVQDIFIAAIDGLATFFDYPAEIRRLIYTTNTIEGYNRQLRKVLKNKASFPTAEAARKLLYLAHRNIVKKWNRPLLDWPKILNQLAIRFEGRIPV